MSDPEKSTLVHWARALTSFLSLGALLIASFIAVNVWFSEWRNLPNTVKQNTLTLQSLSDNLSSVVVSLKSIAPDLNIIDLLGGIEVLNTKVKAGETIWVVVQARANIDCSRVIRVRFFDEQIRNLLSETRDDRARKAAVSPHYQLLVIPVKTFDTMEPGFYRYAPELIPEKGCEPYLGQQLPLSNRFEIVE